MKADISVGENDRRRKIRGKKMKRKKRRR